MKECFGIGHLTRAPERVRVRESKAVPGRPCVRLIRIASDSMAACLKACEARLHQATDYQIVLQREATERARNATTAWQGMPGLQRDVACLYHLFLLHRRSGRLPPPTAAPQPRHPY